MRISQEKRQSSPISIWVEATTVDSAVNLTRCPITSSPPPHYTNLTSVPDHGFTIKNHLARNFPYRTRTLIIEYSARVESQPYHTGRDFFRQNDGTSGPPYSQMSANYNRHLDRMTERQIPEIKPDGFYKTYL